MVAERNQWTRLPTLGLTCTAKHVCGGVAEWLKAHAWKVCIRETVSRVRIPLPPPVFHLRTPVRLLFCHVRLVRVVSGACDGRFFCPICRDALWDSFGRLRHAFLSCHFWQYGSLCLRARQAHFWACFRRSGTEFGFSLRQNLDLSKRSFV